jgi:hypothetical protein
MFFFLIECFFYNIYGSNQFDPFNFIFAQEKLEADTTSLFGTTIFSICFSFRNNLSEQYTITRIGLLKPYLDSISIKSCTSYVNFDAIENINNSNEPLRFRYSLKVVLNSILYNLTWSANMGTFLRARAKLFDLKQILICTDKNQAQLYLNRLQFRKFYE